MAKFFKFLGESVNLWAKVQIGRFTVSVAFILLLILAYMAYRAWTQLKPGAGAGALGGPTARFFRPSRVPDEEFKL